MGVIKGDGKAESESCSSPINDELEGVLRKLGKAGVTGRSSSIVGLREDGAKEGVAGRPRSSCTLLEALVLCAGVSPPNSIAFALSSPVPNPASSRVNSFSSSADNVVRSISSSSFGNPPAGPGTGLRPSRKARPISEAFHFEYVIFSLICVSCQPNHQCSHNSKRLLTSEVASPKVESSSKKLAEAKNFFAVSLRHDMTAQHAIVQQH